MVQEDHLDQMHTVIQTIIDLSLQLQQVDSRRLCFKSSLTSRNHSKVLTVLTWWMVQFINEIQLSPQMLWGSWPKTSTMKVGHKHKKLWKAQKVLASAKWRGRKVLIVQKGELKSQLLKIRVYHYHLTGQRVLTVEHSYGGVDIKLHPS